MENNFDDFIKSEIEKSAQEFTQNGFSERVIRNLPARKNNYLSRRVIIVLSSIASGFIYVLINGFNQVLTGFYNFAFNLLNHGAVNQEFVLFVVLFSIVSLSIPLVEYRRRAL